MSRPVRRRLYDGDYDTPARRSYEGSMRGGPGHYRGALPKPKRTKRPGKFALYGFRGEFERFGTPSQSNVCYLGATSAPSGSIGLATGIAFIRKAMKDHYGYEYTDPDQLLRSALSGTGSGTSPANALSDYFPAAIKFWRRTERANQVPLYDVPATYSFAVGDTLVAFGVWFHTNVFSHPAFKQDVDGTSNTYTLHAFQFVEYDSAPGAASYARNRAVVPLHDQYVDVYSTVRMHIQNVTPADLNETGANLLATRIDANPIKGKLMRFKDAVPLLNNYRGSDGSALADNSFRLQQDTNADGIIWPSESLTRNWVQLPQTDQFKNCVGSVNISLEPGAIKDYTITFKYNGTLEKLMRGFDRYDSLSNGDSPVAPMSGQFGTSFLFAMEKRMPTGNAPVLVNFHYEHYYGACFGRRKKPVMVSLNAQEVNGSGVPIAAQPDPVFV